MTLPGGHELLESQLGKLDDSKRKSSEALTDALGRIPLAITQAAAFIQQNGITISEYLEMLDTDDSETQALLDEDSGDLRRNSESQNSVFRTWKLAFDFVQKQKPRAAEMLSLTSVLDRQKIPRSLLHSEGDRNADMTAALGILLAICLINSRGGSIDTAEYELH